MTCTTRLEFPDDLFDPIADDPNMLWIIDNLWTALNYDRVKHKGDSILISGSWCIRPHPEIELFPRYLDRDLMLKHTDCSFPDPMIELAIELTADPVPDKKGCRRFVVDKELLDLTIYINKRSEWIPPVEIMHRKCDNDYIFELMKYCISRRASFNFEFNSDF